MKSVTVEDMIKYFDLELVAGESGIVRDIICEDVHRPGLELTGYLDLFPSERIQIIGRQESTYIRGVPISETVIANYVGCKPPCIIIAHGENVENYFIEHCNLNGVALLKTPEKTSSFESRLINFLEKALAIELGIHAVCVNVHGVGVLIRGESGIGKSEAALSLIERGHRLVSDDQVILKKIGPEALIASSPDITKNFLSLRGIGLIDVVQLYGVGSYQNETKVKLEIFLSPWDKSKYYDGIGITESSEKYLGIEIKKIEIPIRPGRDIASLIDVAVKNFRLALDGYRALDILNERITKTKN